MAILNEINKQPGAIHVREGFSLIEIMVVIGIIGGIMALVYPMINNARSKMKRSTAESTLRSLDTGINDYKMDTGQYPSSLKDLVKRPSDERLKWKEKYFPKKSIPEDPWDNKYQYKETPDAEKKYTLYSYGPNGRKAPKIEWITLDDE